MLTLEQRLARLEFQLWSLKIDAEVQLDSGFGVCEKLEREIHSFTCAVAALKAQLASK